MEIMGLRNEGNSCFINAAIQAAASLGKKLWYKR